MNLWIAFVSAYFLTGAVLAVTGPLARRRRRDVQTTKWRHLFTDPPIPQWKFTALNLAIGALIVVLWPVGLASERGGSTEPDVELPESFPALPAGLTFQLMGGAGQLRCADCDRSQEVLSFTHGFDGSHTSGYQCQTCGEMHAVDYEPAFLRGTRESDVLFSFAMVRSIETQMAETPRSRWLKDWEPDLAGYRQQLEGADVEAIRRRHAEVQAAYAAKLVCPCGGQLSRDEVVFCPGCRSKNVSYNLRYIT